jgi:hypothetical protein
MSRLTSHRSGVTDVLNSDTTAGANIPEQIAFQPVRRPRSIVGAKETIEAIMTLTAAR